MTANLVDIEVYKKPSFGDRVAQTVFWFELSDGKFFSLYVDRLEGARIIKKLCVKRRVRGITRKQKSSVLHLK